MKDNELSLTPARSGRLWLLASLFLVSIPHLYRMPWWLSFTCLALLGWRFLHEIYGFDLPGKGLRLIFIFLAFSSVFFIHHTIVGRDPGVVLLTIMMCLKLLEMHTIRDAMITLFIGYFMVISGFLFSQTIFMGAYLFFVVLTLTASLVAINHHSGNLSQSKYYLIFSGKLLFQALPIMILMFLLFPRLTHPLWHIPDNPKQSLTGLSDGMELGSINNLVESEEIAFRVDFNGPIPPPSQLYWRGPVLWNTDGKRWEKADFESSKTLPVFTNNGNEIAYSVILEPHNRHWLFALDLPLHLPHGLQGTPSVTPDFQLLSKTKIHNKTRYSIRSTTDYRLTFFPEWMKQLSTRLPSDANPQTRALAKQWVDEGLTQSAIVERALLYFREQPFYYTRQPPSLGENPVDQFLFQTRRGFCEHYAASFATLMRSAGIPARVVTGYQGGEFNNVGDYLIVRQSNAHAWTEVWLQQRGWVRIDPTAEIPSDRVATSADSVRFQSTTPAFTTGDISFLRNAYWKFVQSWDAVNHTWTRWVLGFDRETQKLLLKKLGLDKFSWQSLIIFSVIIIAVFLTLIGFNLLRGRSIHNDPVVHFYHRFCLKLEKAGILRQSDEGPRDFANRISRLRPELTESINTITDCYVRLRYAKYPVDTDLKTFKNLIRSFKPGNSN